MQREGGVEEEEEHAAHAAPVGHVGPSSEDRLAIEAAQARYGRAKEAMAIERRREATLRVADLPLGLDSAIRVHEEDAHRAAIRAAVVVLVGAHGQVHIAVAIQVANSGDGDAKVVIIVERGGEPAMRTANLLVSLDGAIHIHEQDVHRAAVHAALIIV